MKTRCPYCDTRYDIEEDTLQATDGLARCYRCEGIFNAYEQFLPDLAPATRLTPSQPVDVDRLATRLRSDQSLPPATGADTPPEPPPPRPFPKAADEPPHSALVEEDWDADLIDLGTPEARRRGPWRTLGGVLAIVLLSAGAAAQLAWQERDWLLAQASLRPLLERACTQLDCTVPLPRAPHRFEVMQRRLQPVAAEPGAMRLDVSFRNQAGFAQPLPELELSLFDTRQTLLARRRFDPAEYLGQAKLPDAVAAGEIVSARLLLEDPGPAATGFELAFR
jgi:predicted Zn finger-like uncharacterized protein